MAGINCISEKSLYIKKTFPAEEKYGLISQINRAVISIPSNIAEGSGRNTKGEFRNFLGMLMDLYLNWKLN